ncbi:MAG: TerB family tellurite resistance protein [Gammaproteobacteria bacterium]
MLDTLKRYFEGRLATAEHDDTGVDAVELATAALLVEMQRADLVADELDEAEIRALLARHFSLDDEAVSNLISLANDRADHAVSLHEFTRLIHDRFDTAQKTTVVEMLWRVAFADGRVDAHEEHLVRKVADLLYLPQVAFIKAKERAKTP